MAEVSATGRTVTAALGAAAGSAVWQDTVSRASASPTKKVIVVLAVLLMATSVIGYLSVRIRESLGALAVWSAAGTVASLLLIAGFGVNQRPAWPAVVIVGYPVMAVTGYAAGRVLARWAAQEPAA